LKAEGIENSVVKNTQERKKNQEITKTENLNWAWKDIMIK